MDNDTNIRLILSIIGSEGVEKLRASTAALKGQLQDTADSYGKGELTAQQFEAAQRKLSSEIDRQADLLRRLDREQEAVAAGGIVKVADASEKAGSKMAGFGQSAMQAGRFLQDFQAAGVMGIANNLEGLAMALGGGPGLAGALTLAAVAWLSFGSTLKEIAAGPVADTKDRVEKLKAEIEALEKQEIKLNVDRTRLEQAREELRRIEEGLKVIEAAGRTQAYYEKLSGAQIEETVVEEGPGGKGAVLAKIAKDEADAAVRESGALRGNRQEQERLVRDIETMKAVRPSSPEEAEANARIIASQEDQLAKLRVDAGTIERDVRQTASAQAGDTYKLATTGSGAGQLQAQQALSDMLRRSGFGALAGSVGGLSPSAVQAGEESDSAFDAAIADRKDAVKRRNEKAKEVAKQAALEMSEADTGAEANAAAQAQAQRAGRAFNADVDRSVKQFAAGPLDEMAKEFASRLQAQGGDFDQEGRFRALDSNGQFARLASEIQRVMRQANPRQDPAVTEAAAAKMAQQATEGLGLTRGVVGSMMGLSQVQTNMLTEMDQLRAESNALGRAVGANLTRSGRRRPMNLAGPGG